MDAGELDHDLVGALLADLGLGDAELVDALAHDRDGAVERGRVELLPLGGLRLQHDLEAALEVEPEGHFLVRRGARNGKRGHSRQCGEDQADEDEVRTAVLHPRRAESLASLRLTLL